MLYRLLDIHGRAGDVIWLSTQLLWIIGNPIPRSHIEMGWSEMPRDDLKVVDERLPYAIGHVRYPLLLVPPGATDEEF